MSQPGAKISAFVVTYNRAAIVGTCLRSARFADEVIVVDKSSTDATPRIAAGLADRVITVPWSPTVEETRGFAAAQCAHDWILFLDDDECLSPAAAGFVRDELAQPRADAYAFPLRHYILGVHDERAYYWPERHIRLFRRGALRFAATVHAGTTLLTDRVFDVPVETGVCVHHLSHADIAQWIEKANRYTSRPERARVDHAGQDLIGFAHRRIDHWLARSHDHAPDGYPAAVALLRAVYDLIDRLKTWEEEAGLDGAARFRAVCQSLEAGFMPDAGPRTGMMSRASPPAAAPANPVANLRRTVAALRAQYDADMLQAAMALAAAEAGRAAAEQRAATAMEARLAAERAHGATLRRAEAAERAREAIERSTCWRATAWPRRVATRLRLRG